LAVTGTDGIRSVRQDVRKGLTRHQLMHTLAQFLFRTSGLSRTAHRTVKTDTSSYSRMSRPPERGTFRMTRACLTRKRRSAVMLTYSRSWP